MQKIIFNFLRPNVMNFFFRVSVNYHAISSYLPTNVLLYDVYLYKRNMMFTYLHPLIPKILFHLFSSAHVASQRDRNLKESKRYFFLKIILFSIFMIFNNFHKQHKCNNRLTNNSINNCSFCFLFTPSFLKVFRA